MSPFIIPSEIAPKIQELIPLVFPLTSKAEILYVVTINVFAPPLIFQVGSGSVLLVFHSSVMSTLSLTIKDDCSTE
jgi:hypothetical protein